MKLGPRVYVKRDEESRIGRGCELYGGHFRPEISRIPWSACTAARELVPAIKEVWLTEGRRPFDGKGRDLHPELRALDITFRLDGGLRPTRANLERIAARMRELLGPDYDIQIHAVGTDAIHIHAELDPK